MFASDFGFKKKSKNRFQSFLSVCSNADYRPEGNLWLGFSKSLSVDLCVCSLLKCFLLFSCLVKFLFGRKNIQLVETRSLTHQFERESRSVCSTNSRDFRKVSSFMVRFTCWFPIEKKLACRFFFQNASPACGPLRLSYLKFELVFSDLVSCQV